MIIKLANGTELTPIIVTGATSYIQGAKRDTLSFVFPGTANMIELDTAFTASACETISIVGDDGSESIYKAYTIRGELKKTLVEVSPSTADSDAVTEERIIVSMGQRTYTESQLASLTETVDVLVMESLLVE